MNFPPAFLKRMQKLLGPEFEDFVTALRQPPPASIRFNPRKPGAQLPTSERVPWHPHGWYLHERPSFTLDPAYHGGGYYIQEASSMFLHEILCQIRPSSERWRVLDLCAAPGGKSTLLLSAMQEGDLLVANEMAPARVPALKYNLTRWGYSGVMASNHPPAAFTNLKGFFDLIVVDAPCSGEGMFRKDPGALEHWSPTAAEQCAERQDSIIDQVLPALRAGGWLIYSTCTFNPSENEYNIARWLQRYDLEEVPLRLDSSHPLVPAEHGYYFYPHRVKGEGFFICLMRKKSGASFKAKKLGLPRGITRLPSRQVNFLRPWLGNADRFLFYQKANGTITALTPDLEADFATLGNVLQKRSFGLKIGKLKGSHLLPDHALAMCLELSEGVPTLQLDLEAALQYLKRAEPPLPSLPKPGWYLVRHGAFNLGWVKVLSQRINNYLPMDNRIRMDLPE